MYVICKAEPNYDHIGLYFFSRLGAEEYAKRMNLYDFKIVYLNLEWV